MNTPNATGSLPTGIVAISYSSIADALLERKFAT
jgi:hypothetical protein